MILLMSCGQNKPENGGASEENTEQTHEGESEKIAVSEVQMDAVGIQLGKIEQRELNSVIRVNGEMDLDPQKKAEVTSLVGGIIKQVLVIEGKRVSAGQAVAYLENTEIVELQKNYLTSRKEALIAEQEYNRQKELSSQGAGVQKTFQQATAAYEIAKAQLIGLEKQLRQLSISPEQVSAGNMVTQIPIKSPISGTVRKINISTGSYVDTQTSLMSVSDNSAIHCDMKVFEKDINAVKIGQEVDILLTNQPGVNLKGEIYEINKSFESESKAILVHVRIKNQGSIELIPGMYATGLINTGKQKTPAVPNDAVISSEGKKYIFVLEDKENGQEGKNYHFKREEVITGISELGFTQITPVNQLKDDVTIVTANAFYIASMASDHGEHGH
ncbi:membrane fusion protein, cobalt-zinc-cadmium efflux system [Dysgonomonas macrotermitis]|uniref:Membrane fusion protein, cobalt-zinc-cadmium efflux system n=1 Tax=Dysgonomonas macrotermitis TaxID=1346286 RepID=A0A1M5BP24_9BACT|nr:membrane fusion protein, cobalt-zinc-cadmium efflux system [Dysgonomonas macrotermitis]